MLTKAHTYTDDQRVITIAAKIPKLIIEPGNMDVQSDLALYL
jgi:hypothetical protein